MRNLIFIFAMVCCAKAQAQTEFCSPAIADSIHLGMIALVNDTLASPDDTLVQVLDVFYDANDSLFINLGQLPGGYFRAISHNNKPESFKFVTTGIRKAWDNREIDIWLSGWTSNYSGYSCIDDSSNRNCTITISATKWDATSTDDTQALGLAFYHFLIDNPGAYKE